MRTVVIVDDHAGFRASATALLEAEGFAVVGAADGAASGIEVALRMRPDILLLDVQLPDGDGFAVAERLARARHPPDIVLVSNRSAATYRRRLAAAGVRGFLTKSDLTSESLAALLA